MKKIKVDIKSNSYEVIVGSDLVNQENLKRLKGKEVLLVADEKVPSEYKNSIIEVLSDLSSNFKDLINSLLSLSRNFSSPSTSNIQDIETPAAFSTSSSISIKLRFNLLASLFPTVDLPAAIGPINISLIEVL